MTFEDVVQFWLVFSREKNNRTGSIDDDQDQLLAETGASTSHDKPDPTVGNNEDGGKGANDDDGTDRRKGSTESTTAAIVSPDDTFTAAAAAAAVSKQINCGEEIDAEATNASNSTEVVAKSEKVDVTGKGGR